MPKQVTLVELGRVLGLDKSSVSLALRNSPKVSAQTRSRVRAAARRYGYKPNLAARQLRRSGPQMVWLVMPEKMEPLTHPEPVETIRVLSDLVSRGGLLFAIVSASSLGSIIHRDSAYPLFPDAAFIWGDVSCETADLLDGPEIPHVVLDPNHLSYATYPGAVVGIDNAGGAAALTRHLLDRGAERLFFIQTTARHLSHDQRWQAARREWVAARGAQSLTFCHLQELRDDDLTAFAARPRGAFQCSNDQGAMNVWHRLSRLGIGVPERVFLTGFDGNESGRPVGLTTALFDAVRLAETGWDMLMLMVAGKPVDPARLTIPVALRIGATTGNV